MKLQKEISFKIIFWDLPAAPIIWGRVTYFPFVAWSRAVILKRSTLNNTKYTLWQQRTKSTTMASCSASSPLHSVMAGLLSEQNASPKEVRSNRIWQRQQGGISASPPTEGYGFQIIFPHAAASPTQLRKIIQHSRWESACDTVEKKTNKSPVSRWESPNMESRFEFPACPSRRSGDVRCGEKLQAASIQSRLSPTHLLTAALRLLPY